MVRRGPRSRPRSTRLAAAGAQGRQRTGPVGPVPAHSLLPQALQVLLLSRLHRQERRRRRNLRRGPVARDRAGQPLADHGQPAVPLRLFRRRNAFVLERQAAWLAGRSPAGQHQLGRGRRGDLRVRARHALGAQGQSLARTGRHAVEPGRRELQRRRAGGKRPGPPFRRSLQVVGLDPGSRLSQRQHRPDRRHGRRNVGQLEGLRAPAPSSCRPTA